MFRAWLVYEAQIVNPLNGRVGRWRVVNCYEDVYFNLRNEAYPLSVEKRPVNPNPTKKWRRHSAVLLTQISRFYRSGTFVNPTKELKKVLEARRGSA